MSFEYKMFQQSHIISDTEEDLIVNSTSADTIFIRMIHLTNVGAGAGEVKLFVVPHATNDVGTPNADDMIYKESIAIGASVTLEFPVPGIILEYHDVLRGVCDTANTINLVITGGRDY